MDTCSWTETSVGSFKWTWTEGQTPDTNTGPTGDHTTGTGKYLYIDASSGVTGDMAHLTSAVIPQTGPGCELVFYYHMYGDHIGQLQV